ncbi:MAG: GAF domain-containing sensor histidine kinase [Gemmatimonadota bacterium]|nr:GAF domain-containing sensor histidine kinase [Gemmatimonadota bacterium]
MEQPIAALAQRNRELTILNTIARQLNGSAELSAALAGALEQITAHFDLQTGWIWLLDEESGKSYLAAARNLPPALADDPRSMEGDCYCLRTLRTGDLQGAANVNAVVCSRLGGRTAGTAGLRHHASVPLYAQEKKLGMLNVVSSDWQEIAAEDLRLLETVGDMLGIAIERARLFDQSAELGAVEERNRLAREIHDILGQGQAAVLMQLEAMDALFVAGAKREKLRRILSQLMAMVRDNLEEVRRSVADLRAASLEGRSLEEALAGLAADTGPEVEVEIVGTRPLPSRVEVGLYRIAQEALANARQHANARQVRLELEITPAAVTLRIADDGRGFAPEQLSGDRFGLVGLNERARLLGGRLDVESKPGQGTRIIAVVPLEADDG